MNKSIFVSTRNFFWTPLAGVFTVQCFVRNLPYKIHCELDSNHISPSRVCCVDGRESVVLSHIWCQQQLYKFAARKHTSKQGSKTLQQRETVRSRCTTTTSIVSWGIRIIPLQVLLPLLVHTQLMQVCLIVVPELYESYG